MTQLHLVAKPQSMRLNRTLGLARGLVGAWMMNERGGTTIHDLAHGNHGVLAGSWDGDAVSLNGAGDKILIPDAPSLYMVGNMSLVMRVRFDSLSGSRTFVRKGVAATAGITWLWYWIDGTHLLGFYTGAQITAAWLPVIDVWYDIAITGQGGMSQFYVDGLPLVTSGTVAFIDFATPWNVGEWGASDLPGDIKFLLAYNRMLTGNEVRSLHVDPYQLVRLPSYTYKSGAAATADIQLDWTDNSENEDGFSIERDDDGAGFVEVDTVGVGVETYDDLALPTGVTYTYRVKATSVALGDSEYSNEAEVIV